MIELSNRSYCPVLDEMLRFYYHFQVKTLTPVGFDINKYRAKAFLENTKSDLNSILNNVGRIFTSGDFEFDKHISADSIHRFVENFEKFVHQVVKEVKYILGL